MEQYCSATGKIEYGSENGNATKLPYLMLVHEGKLLSIVGLHNSSSLLDSPAITQLKIPSQIAVGSTYVFQPWQRSPYL